MAYEPTNWEDGDVITAEKMNKIENGIQENQTNIFVVDITMGSNNELNRDKNYQDVLNAYNEGQTIVFNVRDPYNTRPLCLANFSDGDGGADYFSSENITISGPSIINQTYYFRVRRCIIKLDSTDKMTISSKLFDIVGTNVQDFIEGDD